MKGRVRMRERNLIKVMQQKPLNFSRKINLEKKFKSTTDGF